MNVNGYEIKAKADLREADLQGADLQEANLRGANLQGANLQGADLRWADLREAKLQEADLRWANLRWADLQWANLRGADLRWADLREAYLQRVIGFILLPQRSDGYQFYLSLQSNLNWHIVAGCRNMTIDDYRKHVYAEYPDTSKADETLAILGYAVTLLEIYNERQS